MERVAVITGASQGLGLALARGLAGRGWTLVVDARRRDRLDAAVDELSRLTTVIGIAGDVTDPSHRSALVAEAARRGAIHLVVNNASTLGERPMTTLDRTSLADLRTAFDVNVVAPVVLLQHAVPLMPAGATIVNITSDAAVEAYPTWGSYGATKAALEHASRVLAAEHPDLRVLVVDPGDMRTEMHQDAFPDEDISDRPEPDTSVPGLLALIEGDRPSGRYHAREVA